MQNSFTVAEAQARLEYYCAYQERCHQEVIRKLESMHMIPEAIDHIVVYLIQHNFLNEERFARSFARGKHRIKAWGRVRIINELKFRNISSYNIDRALDEINPKYDTTFDTVSEQHWAQLRETDMMKKRKKFCDFLLRKGYESSMVYEKVKQLGKVSS